MALSGVTSSGSIIAIGQTGVPATITDTLSTHGTPVAISVVNACSLRAKADMGEVDGAIS